MSRFRLDGSVQKEKFFTWNLLIQCYALNFSARFEVSYEVVALKIKILADWNCTFV